VMNPLVQSLLMGFLRWALQGAFVWMTARGIMQPDQAELIVVGLAGALSTLAWVLWVKFRERQKLLTAAAKPAGTSERTVEAAVAEGKAPPVTLDKDARPHLSDATAAKSK
jgi:hypothetical protein